MPVLLIPTVTFHLLMRLPNAVQVDYFSLYLSQFSSRSYIGILHFAMNSRRSCSLFVCFIYELEEKNSKSEVIFAVCR